MARKAKSAPVDDEPLDDVEDAASAEVDDEIDDESQEGDVSAVADDEGESQEPEQPHQPSWREQLGPEFAELDDATALARIQENLRQAQQYQAAAQQWQHLYASQAQALQQQQMQQQAAAAQKPQEPSWKPPEFNPAWLQQLTKNEAGETVLKPGADPTILSKIQAYVAWKEEQEQKFFSNPYDFILPGIQPKVEQLIDQRVQQALSMQADEFAVAQWERDNIKVLTTDGRAIAPNLANLSPIGRAIVEKSQELLAAGIGNRRAALERAYEIVAGNVAWAQLTQKQQEAQLAKNATGKKEAFLRTQATKRNRDGTFAKNGKTEPIFKKRLSFKERLRSEFEHATGNTNSDED